MGGKKRKYYAVSRGRKTGIFSTWDECKEQVNGFRDCRYKAFSNLSDAETFVGTGIKNFKPEKSSSLVPSIHTDIDGADKYRAQVALSSSFSKKSASYYAVCRGHKTGIFSTWEQCKAQVNGFSNSLYKRFNNRKEAEAFIKENGGSNIAEPPKKTLHSIGSMTAKTEHDPSNELPVPPVSYSKETAFTSSFAQKMMQKMGYTDGKGLGKHRQGIISPLKAVGIPSTINYNPGLGYGKEKLNNQQKAAVELVKSGKNVFITGPGGTGKSVVIRQLMIYFKEKYRDNENQYVAVAPTGTTAISIGGQTIHSFSGCGIPETAKDFQKCWNKRNRKRWRDLQVMIIEEVSMISGEFFDRLSDVVSQIRENKLPFGGIQLILCGDFLQLPPIETPIYKQRAVKAALSHQSDGHVELHLDRGFAFQAHAWKRANLSIIQLDQVFRQSNTEFISVLHEIRRGQVSNKAISFLRQCDRPLPPNKDGIEPTILYARNKDVTSENMAHLHKLPGKLQSFKAKDRVDVDINSAPGSENILLNNTFFKNCIAEKTLSLKVGAQVMLLKNEKQDERKDGKMKLVNGSRGKIVGFINIPGDEEEEIPGFIDKDEEKKTSFPTKVEENLENKSDKDFSLFPVVLFQNNVRRVIKPETFESRLVGIGTCIRETIPLKLAWAVTVHKSQGMTLDCVKVDLSGVFADAQAYVALSRASDEKGLELRNFSKSTVHADKRATTFYESPNKILPHWSEQWESSCRDN